MSEEVVLGRIGHYHDPGSGACSTALVTGVSRTTALTVNLRVWQSDAEDERHLAVPVASPTEHGSDGSHATFHLTRDCRWER